MDKRTDVDVMLNTSKKITLGGREYEIREANGIRGIRYHSGLGKIVASIDSSRVDAAFVDKLIGLLDADKAKKKEVERLKREAIERGETGEDIEADEDIGAKALGDLGVETVQILAGVLGDHIERLLEMTFDYFDFSPADRSNISRDAKVDELYGLIMEGLAMSNPLGRLGAIGKRIATAMGQGDPDEAIESGTNGAGAIMPIVTESGN